MPLDSADLSSMMSAAARFGAGSKVAMRTRKTYLVISLRMQLDTYQELLNTIHQCILVFRPLKRRSRLISLFLGQDVPRVLAPELSPSTTRKPLLRNTSQNACSGFEERRTGLALVDEGEK